jgi:hypothetical protein
VSKRARLNHTRRKFEGETLRKLKAAGGTPRHLARCQWLLTKGRRLCADDMETALNKASQEKAGIEFNLRALRGDAPELIIFNRRSVPAPSYHG